MTGLTSVTALRRGAAAVCLTIASCAAASAETPADGKRAFSIRAQPLQSAIVSFSKAAGVDVIGDGGLARGARSPGVVGVMTPAEALGRLTAGTGASFRFTDATTVTLLAPVAEPMAQEGVVDLAEISVLGDGSGLGDGTVGFVPKRSAAALKTDTPVLEVPQSVSVVTRAELDARGVQTDAEALTYVPGVFAQPFGGAQNQYNPFFYIRGFSSAFGGSYVDGLVSYVNYRFEPYNFERYDVFRGPTSTLYGQSDPGGLVDRTSKLPTADPRGEIQLQGGNFDRLQGAVDVSGPIDAEGQFLYRMVALGRNADAPNNFKHGVDQPDERVFLAPSFTWRPSEDTTLTILGTYLKDRIGAENSYVRPDGEVTRISLNGPDDANWRQEQWSAGWLFEHRFSDDLIVRQKSRYSEMDSTVLGLWQTSADDAGPIVERYSDGNDEKRHDFVSDTQLQYKVATGPVAHTILAGFDFQDTYDWISFKSGEAPPLDLNDPDYSVHLPPATPWLQNEYKGRSYGLYFQDQAKIADKWVLTLGGRQDWSRSTNVDEWYGEPTQKSRDDKFTYRAGLTYLTDFGLAPYASYTQSFLPQGGVGADGVAFRPTEGEQYEAGVKYQPPGVNALLTAAVFDLTKTNVIYYDYSSGVGVPTQAGEVRSRGLELQAQASLKDGWSLMAAYTYADVEVTKDVSGIEGNRPTLTPKHMASAWLDYTFSKGPADGLSVGGGVRYIGKTFGDPQNTLRNDDYALVDAAVRYDLGKLSPKLEGLKAAVNATNLLGNDYTFCYMRGNCKWGAQRTVTATLTYRW